MNTHMIPFNFGSSTIRVTTDDRCEPWFVASDIAKELGYRDAHNLARILDEEEKGTRVVSTPSGSQEMTVMHPVCPWEEYERRKAAIQRQGLSDREYELAIRRLADELGV